jgi:hypothetical protein
MNHGELSFGKAHAFFLPRNIHLSTPFTQVKLVHQPKQPLKQLEMAV